MRSDQLQKVKMKSKVEIVLYIYDQLKDGRSINAFQVMNEFNICDRTFRRYISDINAYLCNQYKNVQIVYNRATKEYVLE